jgi:hypothetical protein
MGWDEVGDIVITITKQNTIKNMDGWVVVGLMGMESIIGLTGFPSLFPYPCHVGRGRGKRKGPTQAKLF